jgi:hypothetical protein
MQANLCSFEPVWNSVEVRNNYSNPLGNKSSSEVEHVRVTGIMTWM